MSTSKQTEINDKNNLIRSLLVGATLDQFLVQSLVIRLQFQKNANAEAAVTVVVEVTGNLDVKEVCVADSDDVDFFERRCAVFPALYRAIGYSVRHAALDASGLLQISIDKTTFCIGQSGDDLETVWSIGVLKPGTDRPTWSISLDDFGEVHVPPISP